MAFFQKKLQTGLSKTRESFWSRMAGIFSGRRIDADLYEELEDILIQADVGVNTSLALTERLRKRVKEEKIADSSQLKPILVQEMTEMLTANEKNGFELQPGRLNILIMVGVNGAGKTTTIGKIASRYSGEGKKVLLAAADTFRAAATEQLSEWAKRAGTDIIRQGEGADPGAVVFDACHSAVSRKCDLLIVDTAGRLQNKNNLMEELKKIGKIIAREAPEASVETWLVLDAGTGQNAISQAKLFGEAVFLSGLVLTKLDGTAKGGVVIGIANESKLPVKMIGVGEGIDDLREFDAQEFATALFGE